MESPLSFFRMHWVHEPTRNRSAGFPACGFTGHSCPVFLLRATGKSPEPADWKVCPTHPSFMGSRLSLVRMHRDHEPAPIPSQEGSRTPCPGPLLGGVRGGFVADR